MQAVVQLTEDYDDAREEIQAMESRYGELLDCMDKMRDEIANQKEMLEHSKRQNNRLREEISRLSEHVDGARDEITNQEEMSEQSTARGDS